MVPPPPSMPLEKSVKSVPIPQAPDPRDQLLESIRRGKELRKVDLEEKPAISSSKISNDKPDTNDLAKSLNDFLNARKDKIRDSDSETDDEGSDDWE